MKKRRTMGKKAFLFTLGMLLVTLAILSFAKFVSEESEAEKEFFQIAAITNRLYDADSSLQRSIADMFILQSNIRVSRSNHSIIFEEPLPNDEGFGSGLARLKKFAEANDTSIHIDDNDTVSGIPLFILPQNAVYMHNFSSREILVALPGDFNSSITKYKTTLTITENVTCSWSSYTPGDFNYQLDVISPKESGECDSTKQLDLESNATITIASQQSPSNRIYLSLGSDSIRIKMDDAGRFNISAKSEITFYSAPEDVWLGNGTVEIRFDEFNLKKKGGVRII